MGTLSRKLPYIVSFWKKSMQKSKIGLIDHGLLYIWTELLSIFILLICPHEAGTWDPNYTPRVDFLDSSEDLSNKGSPFFLSSLKVGH